MKVKAQDLKVGQWFKVFDFSTKFEQVASVQQYKTGVMVFLASQVDNPFISSQFASYSLDHEIEVLS